MPDFQLIALDIDGTLANPQGELSGETLRVLRRLLAADVEIVLVTGLNPWPARRYVVQIGPIPAICLNGIFLLKGEEIHAGSFLDPAAARAAARFIVARGYVPLVYGADGVTRYLPTTEGSAAMREVAKLFAERDYQPFEPVDGIDALFAVTPAQVSVCETAERAARLQPALAAAFDERAYVVYQPGPRAWLEVNHPDARKDVALVHFAQRRDIPPERIVYFGDSLNDLPVFRALPRAVAMGNARPEVKELAWRIAPSNEEDGVARMLEELFVVSYVTNEVSGVAS
ncbi:MAG: HAD family hydrolase [Anaerolineales bacterium]